MHAEVQRRAAAEGTTDAAVVEAALRSYLGLGGLIDRIHERNRYVNDEDITALAYEELGAYRAERDASQRAPRRKVAEPLRVVVDPGVLVSAIVTPHGPTGQLIAGIRTGLARPVMCRIWSTSSPACCAGPSSAGS